MKAKTFHRVKLMKSKTTIFFPNVDQALLSALRLELYRHGYEFSESASTADVVFHVKTDAFVDKDQRNILLQLEPFCVDAQQYSTRKMRRFDYVIPLSRYRAENLNSPIWLDMPVLKRKAVFSNRRDEQATMVNAAKFSAYKMSNYGLRREVLVLDAANDARVDLFGDHWNERISVEIRRRLASVRATPFHKIDFCEAFSHSGYRYPQHKGKISQGFEEVQKYRTAIVIENQSDYVSEKIWKFLFNGVVPVYVGPNLSFDRQIEEFIEVVPPKPDVILERALQITENDRMRKIRNFLKFIDSKEFQHYSPENCAHKFVESLLSHRLLDFKP